MWSFPNLFARSSGFLNSAPSFQETLPPPGFGLLVGFGVALGLWAGIIWIGIALASAYQVCSPAFSTPLGWSSAAVELVATCN
jgi:hypothetical protein